nr:hypothetical protein [Tanacetum cinerariifolium]
MDTLSFVSKYLNDLEEYLDDMDSLEARKLTIEKSKEELELFEALEHKNVVIKEGKHRVVVFTKAPPRTFSKPFTRFSLPCDVDGQGAWDTELDMADSFNYMTNERFDKLGFIRVDYGKYGRKMVKEVRVENHGFTFLVDFVVIGYANEGEHLVIFGRYFLVTLKSKVDFGICEIRINLTKLEEEKEFDAMLEGLVEKVEEVELELFEALEHKNVVIKEGKHRVVVFTKAPPRTFSKPFTRKKLDEVMMGRARLSSDEFGEEKKMRIVEHGVNGTVEMRALADTRASVSILPYSLFKNLGVSDLKPYNSNLTIADKPQAKAMGEVRNVRTYGAVVYMRGDTMSIDDGLIRHTYFPKPRAKAYLDNLELGEEDDWLSCFEVGRYEDGNPKYGPVAPSFLDIEDDTERALAMEAYFNPFKNIIVFKKLINLVSLSVQLKNTDWGNEGHGVYKKIEGDGAWHEKFQVITPTNRDPTRTNPRTSLIKEPLMRIVHRLLNKMKFEYIHSDGDVFEDYSWVIALSIRGDVYPEWCLEFFSTMYFDKWVDRTKLMKDKANRDPTRTNPMTSLIKEPLMRIVHRLLVGSLVHRQGSKERCQKRDLWLMSALDKSNGINLAWVIVDYLCKYAPGLKENSLICGGHYVT